MVRLVSALARKTQAVVDAQTRLAEVESDREQRRLALVRWEKVLAESDVLVDGAREALRAAEADLRAFVQETYR